MPLPDSFNPFGMLNNDEAAALDEPPGETFQVVKREDTRDLPPARPERAPGENGPGDYAEGGGRRFPLVARRPSPIVPARSTIVASGDVTLDRTKSAATRLGVPDLIDRAGVTLILSMLGVANSRVQLAGDPDALPSGRFICSNAAVPAIYFNGVSQLWAWGDPAQIADPRVGWIVIHCV